MGVGGDPGEVHATAAVLDHHQDVEVAEEDRFDVGEVTARIAWAWEVRNCRQVGLDRRGSGVDASGLEVGVPGQSGSSAVTTCWAGEVGQPIRFGYPGDHRR